MYAGVGPVLPRVPADIATAAAADTAGAPVCLAQAAHVPRSGTRCPRYDVFIFVMKLCDLEKYGKL